MESLSFSEKVKRATENDRRGLSERRGKFVSIKSDPDTDEKPEEPQEIQAASDDIAGELEIIESAEDEEMIDFIEPEEDTIIVDEPDNDAMNALLD